MGYSRRERQAERLGLTEGGHAVIWRAGRAKIRSIFGQLALKACIYVPFPSGLS